MSKFYKGILVGVISMILLFLILGTLFFRGIVATYIYYNKVTSMYDGEVDHEVMMDEIYAGITNGLGDEHSEYLPPDENDSFSQLFEATKNGLGMMYDSSGEFPVVTKILPNSPASLIDLYPGDEIRKINDTIIDETNKDDLISILDQTKENIIEIYRPSTSQNLIVKSKTGTYDSPTVYAKMIDSSTGLIKITTFGSNTASEFEVKLNELETQNIEHLIIDVRDNPGGELDAAIAIANLLIYSDKPFLTIKDEDEVVDEYISKLDVEKNYNISILINENSASASEVLTSALSETMGSIVVGNTSYGKGSVQTYFDTPLIGGGAKITYRHWYTPNDENVDGVGITPDFEVSDEKYFGVEPIVLVEELEFDSDSIQVMQVNYYLSLLGYDVNEFSSKFDEKTKSAVIKFQQENKLEANGVVDVQCADLLYKSAQNNIYNEDNDPYISKAMKENDGI